MSIGIEQGDMIHNYCHMPADVKANESYLASFPGITVCQGEVEPGTRLDPIVNVITLNGKTTLYESLLVTG